MPEETPPNNSSDATKNTKEVASTNQPKIVKPSKIVIYVILIAILVILLGVLAYINLFAGKSAKKETPSQPATTKSAEQKKTKPTAEASYCLAGQIYENKKQGYKVCIIKAWYSKEFNSSGTSVGFDSSPIPEASEYGGLIMVNVSNKTTSEATNTINSSLNGVASRAVTVDGAAGTQISGNIPADSFYYAGDKEIVSIFTKFKRTYEVLMITAPDKLVTNQGLYNDFLASWRFITGTPNPPWSSSGNILVETPWPGDTINNPVTVSGRALVFEGTASIRIKDANGTVLVNTTTQAQSGTELSAFSKSVSYTNPTTATGTVEVFSISAKDGSEQDKVEIPVNFK